jgi:hypothetical protein
MHAAARPPGDRLSSPPPVPIQEQSEKDRTDLPVDLAVDPLGPPAALERLDRLVPVGHVVTEPLEREVERRIVVERVAGLELFGPRQAQPVFGEAVPREQLARIDLARQKLTPACQARLSSSTRRITSPASLIR